MKMQVSDIYFFTYFTLFPEGRPPETFLTIKANWGGGQPYLAYLSGPNPHLRFHRLFLKYKLWYFFKKKCPDGTPKPKHLVYRGPFPDGIYEVAGTHTWRSTHKFGRRRALSYLWIREGMPYKITRKRATELVYRNTYSKYSYSKKAEEMSDPDSLEHTTGKPLTEYRNKVFDVLDFPDALKPERWLPRVLKGKPEKLPRLPMGKFKMPRISISRSFVNFLPTIKHVELNS